MITFFLNGQYHQVTDLNPNTTVLDFLRINQGMTDTKEGWLVVTAVLER